MKQIVLICLLLFLFLNTACAKLEYPVDNTIPTTSTISTMPQVTEPTIPPTTALPVLRDDFTYIEGLSPEENILYRLEIVRYITSLFSELAAIELEDPAFIEKSNIICDKIRELQDLDKQYLNDYLDQLEQEQRKRIELAEIKKQAGLSESACIDYLGEFRLTAYCPCLECSEGYGNSTATGVQAQPNHTIAVDPTVIPYGSKIIIKGQIYTAEDCGGAIKGNAIDIYFLTHEEATNFGLQNDIKVYIIIN